VTTNDENLPGDDIPPEIRDDIARYMLANPEYLRSLGFRATPKGIITLLLSEAMGKTLEEVEALGQKIDDAIFLNGWIYVQADELTLGEAADG
jgi:hypothetical protein